MACGGPQSVGGMAVAKNLFSAIAQAFGHAVLNGNMTCNQNSGDCSQGEKCGYVVQQITDITATQLADGDVQASVSTQGVCTCMDV